MLTLIKLKNYKLLLLLYYKTYNVNSYPSNCLFKLSNLAIIKHTMLTLIQLFVFTSGKLLKIIKHTMLTLIFGCEFFMYIPIPIIKHTMLTLIITNFKKLYSLLKL